MDGSVEVDISNIYFCYIDIILVLNRIHILNIFLTRWYFVKLKYRQFNLVFLKL